MPCEENAPPPLERSAEELDLVAIVDLHTAAALRRVAAEALADPRPELHQAMTAAMRREIDRQQALGAGVSQLVIAVLEDILRDPS